MSTMGRRDGFLSGMHNSNDDRLNEVVAKAIEVAAIPVYCVKDATHVFPLAQLQKDEVCILCKREGVKSDVAIKQEIPAPVFRDDGDNDEDDDSEEGRARRAGARGYNGSPAPAGTTTFAPAGSKSKGLGPKRPVTGGTKRMQKSEEMIETGGFIDGKPIVTRRGGNPRSGTWTGSR